MAQNFFNVYIRIVLFNLLNLWRRNKHFYFILISVIGRLKSRILPREEARGSVVEADKNHCPL